LKNGANIFLSYRIPQQLLIRNESLAKSVALNMAQMSHRRLAFRTKCCGTLQLDWMQRSRLAAEIPKPSKGHN